MNEKPSAATLAFVDDYAEMHRIDKAKALHLIKQTLRYYNGDKSARKHLAHLQWLEVRWYESLAKGIPDYSIYGDEYYFTDTWTCWLKYSRHYLRRILADGSLDGTRSIYSAISHCKSVVDLGCGVGYTTSALCQMFNGRTYGYNIEGTVQWKFCKMLAARHGFSMVSRFDQVPQCDVIFASEYFEHLEAPINELQDIVARWNPKVFLIANSFNTQSIGHFLVYRHDTAEGQHLFKQESANRLFNTALQGLGYRLVKTKLWNYKPALWVRA